jgi:hypothetical protein
MEIEDFFSLADLTPLEVELTGYYPSVFARGIHGDVIAHALKGKMKFVHVDQMVDRSAKTRFKSAVIDLLKKSKDARFLSISMLDAKFALDLHEAQKSVYAPTLFVAHDVLQWEMRAPPPLGFTDWCFLFPDLPSHAFPLAAKQTMKRALFRNYYPVVSRELVLELFSDIMPPAYFFTYVSTRQQLLLARIL